MKAYPFVRFHQYPDVDQAQEDGRKSSIGCVTTGGQYVVLIPCTDLGPSVHTIAFRDARRTTNLFANRELFRERAYNRPEKKAAMRRRLKKANRLADRRFEQLAELE